jgi:hypothetical protein
MHLPEQAPTPSRDSVSQPRDRFVSWMLIACLLFAVGQLGFNAVTLDTWMDEGKYLMKEYWYFTGKIAPYSTVDPSFYMPLSFYSVAPMEWLFGVGYLPGRVLMIVFALGCLVLAYLTGARTGRSRLTGVSAVVLIVGDPVTLTYFATATPYAMVSCLSLALVFVLLVVRSRGCCHTARQASFSGHLCHPARHVADRHDPNRLGAAHRAVAKDRVPCGRLSDLHGRVRCHGAGIRTWIAPGSGYPELAQLAAAIGIPPAPISSVLPLSVSPLDPVLPFGDIPNYFNRYFFRPHSAVSTVTLAMIAFRIFLPGARAASDT